MSHLSLNFLQVTLKAVVLLAATESFLLIGLFPYKCEALSTPSPVSVPQKILTLNLRYPTSTQTWNMVIQKSIVLLVSF